MNEFILTHTITLNNYIVKLYSLNNIQIIDQNTMNNLVNELNGLSTAKDILENVSSLKDIVKTEIFNLDGELLLCNSLVIE